MQQVFVCVVNLRASVGPPKLEVMRKGSLLFGAANIIISHEYDSVLFLQCGKRDNGGGLCYNSIDALAQPPRIAYRTAVCFVSLLTAEVCLFFVTIMNRNYNYPPLELPISQLTYLK